MDYQNFSQDMYDKLKISLISKYNMTFPPISSPSIKEEFEIKSDDGSFTGKYLSNNTLQIQPDMSDSSVYQTILKIIDSIGTPSKVESTGPAKDDHIHLMIKDYAKNTKQFFDHILECKECRDNLAKIWEHILKKQL